jgi:hypothetical protein
MGAQIYLLHQWALIRILFAPTGAYHCPDLAISPFPIIALHYQPSGAKSKHCTASRWAQNPSILPLAIRHKIQASHH